MLSLFEGHGFWLKRHKPDHPKSSQLLFEALQSISNFSFGLALVDNREKGFDRFDL